MQVTSSLGKEDLVNSEGIRTKAYRDSVGVWTIGVGHTASAGEPTPRAGLTLTRSEVFEILARDLQKFEIRVRKRFGRDVPQHVFDGAVSFDFNTGDIDSASWVRAYLVGHTADAERRFLLYNKPPEIRGRRKREADLIFRARYSTKGTGVPEVPAVVDDTMLSTQEMLFMLGFDPGPIDGKYGPKTKAATLAFQRTDPDLVDDGIPGKATRAALARALSLKNSVVVKVDQLAERPVEEQIVATTLSTPRTFWQRVLAWFMGE